MPQQRFRATGARKKIIVLFAIILGCCLLSSLVFNFPIPFRHERRLAARSEHPVSAATAVPDNIVLTPAGDMATGMRITWRTSTSVPDGMVEFEEAGAGAEDGGKYGGKRSSAPAAERILASPELTSDNTVKCFTATLGGLAPGTAYRYRVGSPEKGAWSEYASFSTAPAAPDSFSFVYFGDLQAESKNFGDLLASVGRRHPETAFAMLGGDIADIGGRRNLWDMFLSGAASELRRIPLAPAMGNHDFGDHPSDPATFALYFGLPAGRRPWDAANYSFRYGNACFIVLNSRQRELKRQTGWLEEELRKAEEDGCVFKTVMVHYPVYNPKKNRNNATAQKRWTPLFDKYGVDLVLTGHDHSYLRSKPLRAGKAVPAGESGTVHIVATSCGKFYEFQERDIAERQFMHVATYQMITLGADATGRPLLRYRAHSLDGELVDSFDMVK